jgi:hypothetical protein
MRAIAASAYENGQTAAKPAWPRSARSPFWSVREVEAGQAGTSPTPAVFVQAAEECFRRPSA